MATFLREAGVKRASLSRAAASRLFHGPWPGNVRQLRSTMRTAVFLSGAKSELVIEATMLQELDERAPAQPEPEAEAAPRASQPTREALESALRAAQGRVTAAARALDTSPRQLYRWLERYGLDPDAYRAG